jgi:hypothetical protein
LQGKFTAVVFTDLKIMGTWLRNWYELVLAGIHVITNEGWHDFLIKFKQWSEEYFIRLRIKHNAASYSRNDKQAIARILQKRFKGKTGIRIGGRLSPEYTEHLTLCGKVVDANIA